MMRIGSLVFGTMDMIFDVPGGVSQNIVKTEGRGEGFGERRYSS
jgi:hypothetical protein